MSEVEVKEAKEKVDGDQDKEAKSQSSEPQMDSEDIKFDPKSLSEEQLISLEAFEKALEKACPGDKETQFTHLRFLRARKFDVQAALDMYVNYTKWRNEESVDDILVHPPTEVRELLQRFVPESFHKFDRLGLPGYFIKVGKIYPDEILQNITVEEFIRCHIWGMEYSFQRARESSKRLGKNVDTFVNVVDLDGLSMNHRKVLKYVQECSKLDQQYYPEALGKTYVINPPWVFDILWKIVAPWLDPVTRQKMVVIQGDPKKELLERFGAENLPVEYGGTCRCEGGCIKEYSEAKNKEYLQMLERKLELKVQNVGAGKVFDLKVPCTGEFGAQFSIYFKSEKNDIGFAATFYPQDKKKEPVQWRKLELQDGDKPFRTFYSCTEPGHAIFQFSNYHSYFTAKTVHYKCVGTPHKRAQTAEAEVGGEDVSTPEASA